MYNLHCNASAPATSGPEPLLGVTDGCTYVVTWHTPLACNAVPAEGCKEPTVPVPTAAQLRYQRAEIVALTHFNMASFVQNGDPGCKQNSKQHNN